MGTSVASEPLKGIYSGLLEAIIMLHNITWSSLLQEGMVRIIYRWEAPIRENQLLAYTG